MAIFLYGAAALLIYTFVLLYGIYQAKRESKKSIKYFLKIKEIIEEIRDIILEEEVIVDKGAYKNIRASEGVRTEVKAPYQPTRNRLSLSDLLNQKAEESHYEEVINLLVGLARLTYEDYKFLVARSTDEKKEANFLQLVSNWAEHPELHKQIFSRSMDYGIDMKVLQGKFAERVAEGKVISLGDDVVVITDDGTGQIPTGVSPINSGIEGGEIAFIISFIHKDNLDDWEQHNLPQGASDE